MQLAVQSSGIAPNEPNLSLCLQALGFCEAGIKRADFRNHGRAQNRGSAFLKPDRPERAGPQLDEPLLENFFA